MGKEGLTSRWWQRLPLRVSRATPQRCRVAVHVHSDAVHVHVHEDTDGARSREIGCLSGSPGLRGVGLRGVPGLKGTGSTDTGPTRPGGLLSPLHSILPKAAARFRRRTGGDSFRLPAVRRGNAARFWTFSSGAESSTGMPRAKARTFSYGTWQ